MKKTLTIMMTAATALLGLNSCNDSSSSNNSSSSTGLISVADFVKGTSRYRIYASGVEFTLENRFPGDTDDNAPWTDGDTTAKLTIRMATNDGLNVTTNCEYTVDGATATILITSGWTNTLNESFYKIWGLTFKDGYDEINLGQSGDFKIEISGGVATMIVTNFDPKASVAVSETPVRHTPVQVEKVQPSSSSDTSQAAAAASENNG